MMRPEEVHIPVHTSALYSSCPHVHSSADKACLVGSPMSSTVAACLLLVFVRPMSENSSGSVHRAILERLKQTLSA